MVMVCLWGCQMEKTNSERWDSQKLTLTVVTPLTISTGEVLKSQEYIFNNKTGEVHFLNQILWHQFIYKLNKLKDYEAFMQRPNGNLYQWINSHVGFDAVAKLQKEGIIINTVKVDSSVDKVKLNDICPMMKTAFGIPYIPGSTIKGIIHNAVLHKLLKANPRICAKYWGEIEKKVNTSSRLKADLSGVLSHLEKELLYTIIAEDGKTSHSIMSGIFCSDAYVISDVETAILRRMDLSIYKSPRKDSAISELPIYTENVLPHTKFSFDLKIDKSILNMIGVSSVKSLIQHVNSYFIDIALPIEKNFSKSLSKNNGVIFDSLLQSNAFIGRNTGFLSKTIFLSLSLNAQGKVNIAKTVPIIKLILAEQFDRGRMSHKHERLDKEISPRTIKMTKYKNEYLLTGLARIE